MKGSVRGVGVQRNEADEDPFAELADIFESEVGRAAFRTGATYAPVSQARGVDAAGPHFLDDEFAAAFEDGLDAEMSRSAPPVRTSATDVSYLSWLSPKGAQAPSAAAGISVPRAGATPAEADIETAIRGLSAPANPRDAIVVETQSFAPERVVDEYRHQPAPREMDDFDELIASELAVMHGRVPATSDGASGGWDRHGALPDTHEPMSADDLDRYAGYADFDGSGDEPVAERRSFLARNVRMLAGGVMSLALVGVAGFFAFGAGNAESGLSGSGEPLLIKADAEPYKIVPDNPGGRSIPNQNKAVYERVASPSGAVPTMQEALLTESEEPIDLPPEEEPAPYAELPGVDLVDNEGLGLKGESRIEDVVAAADAGSPVPVLQPRKVRTMVVRPDGTIMQNDPNVTVPLMTAASQVAPAAAASPAPAPLEAPAPVQTPPAPATDIPYATALLDQEAALAPRDTPQPPASTDAADPVNVAAIPAPVPIEPPVAAVQAAPPTGSYFVQISSQPSEALAQQSLQSLGSRYASLIEGRSLGIQPADIPGKGTFYRVRIAAASKDEAGSLCNRLKSAGGNCFVAR